MRLMTHTLIACVDNIATIIEKVEPNDRDGNECNLHVSYV